MLVAACGGSGDGEGGGEIPAAGGAGRSPTADTPDGSATASTSTLDSCPFDRSLCEFSARLEDALAKGDAKAVVDALVLQTVECTGQPAEGIDAAAAICEGKAAGEKAQGYLVGRRASEAVYSRAESVAFTVESIAALQIASKQDDYGPGGMRQTTVAQSPRADCPTCHLLIYTYILTPATDRFSREAVVIEAVRTSDGWLGTYLLSGVIFRDEAKALLSGGAFDSRDYKVWNRNTGIKPVGDGGIYVGMATTVSAATGDCLNVRDAPTTASAVLICRPPGSALAVYNGPTNADHVRWWRVEVLGVQPPVSGWVSAEFLDR